MNLVRHLCRHTIRQHVCHKIATIQHHPLNSITANSRHITSQRKPPGHSETTAPDAITALQRRRDAERLFVIAQSDPDRFGSQHAPGVPVKPFGTAAADTEDAGDRAEEAHLRNPPRRDQQLSTKQYADLIKDHMRNKRIAEAIDVLEVRMIREDRVKPENYIYNLLIGECGRLGYTRKAFGLFTRMKQRGLTVTGGTYTALFNACAETPWPHDGLQKANRLRELMAEKGHQPNASTCNAMIKAYGRLKDLPTAFQLVDEMQARKLPVSVETFNFVLQACASDAELGFRHALLVWHKMLRRRLLPDAYSFNAMLRCVRDCGIGDLETMQAVIEQVLRESRASLKGGAEAMPLRLEANAEEKVLSIAVNESTPVDGSDNTSPVTTATTNTAAIASLDSEPMNTPNLLGSRPHLGRLVALSEVTKPSDRLLLLGGFTGFLAEMRTAGAIPDIKTYTQLVEVLPPTNTAEKALLAALKRDKLKVDIDFFNVLMKKRSMRFDYVGAREVLGLIDVAHLQPDIVTYGVLALGCRTPAEADDLLQQMYDKGVRMNIQILGAMLRQGSAAYNYEYVLKVMSIVLTERIRPNEQFLMHLVRFRTKGFEFRSSGEGYAKTRKFRDEFKRFCEQLEQWRVDMGLHDLTLKEQIAAVRDHPWEQFKYAQPEGVEELKNPKLRHKTKLRRHIQRIKPDRLAGDADEVRRIGDGSGVGKGGEFS